MASTVKPSTFGIAAAAAIALYLAVNVLAGNLFTSLRIDLTADKLYTLSEGTRNILDDLEEPIRLKLYYSAEQFADIPSLQSHGRRVRDLLEEYTSEAGDNLSLEVIDPAPFSEAEDEAVGYGVRQLGISATGDVGYLGLVGTNSTDDVAVLPYLAPDQADALEYEVTKLVYNLANPAKRVVGVVTALPMFGLPPSPVTQRRPAEPWMMIQMLEDSFELRDLGVEFDSVPADIDTLMVVHPKELPRKTVYAIDQFVLAGGKAMVFVDPLAEADTAQPDPNNPMVMPDTSSDLPDLLAAWGVKLAEDAVAGDPEAAIRVQYEGSRGPQTIEYLPWLSLGPEHLSSDDFVTNQLDQVNLGSAGILEPLDGATTTVEPLMTTGPGGGPIPRDTVFFARDPGAMLDNFESADKTLTLAVRVRGPAGTAFPDGRPLDVDEKRAPQSATHLDASKGPINVMVFSDVDLLADRFWVRVESFLGTRVPTPFADNADLVFNALDNLGGNDDLISLRSRGRYERPFEVVNEIRREAEAKFRDREQQLTARLEETEQKIGELQSQRADSGSMLLSPEQRAEIERFRAEQLATRKELRAVQHNLERNIERLGTLVKFINIGLVPVLVLLAAALLGATRGRRLSSSTH